MAAGALLLILIHGDNLLRNDMQLRYRLSPADALQASGALEVISPTQLSEWQVSYLVEMKVWLEVS